MLAALLLTAVANVPALATPVFADLLMRIEDHDGAAERIRFVVRKYGVDVDAAITVEGVAVTPLCLAPTEEIARELIRHGASVRRRGAEKLTAIRCATYYGDPEMISWAVTEFGENINAAHEEGSLLCIASKYRGSAEVETLLAHGANPDDHSQRPPLDCARENRQRSEFEEIIQVLARAGAAGISPHPVVLIGVPSSVPHEPRPFRQAPPAAIEPMSLGSSPMEPPALIFDTPGAPAEPVRVGSPPAALIPPTPLDRGTVASLVLGRDRSSTEIHLTTRLDRPVTLDLVGTRDRDLSQATYQLVTAPAHGVVTLDARGSITYAPTRGAVGRDEFAVEVSVSNHTATRLIFSVDNDLSFTGLVAGYSGSMDSVEVMLEGEGVLRNATPDSFGRFRFYSLPDGEYAVKLRAPGFQPPRTRLFTLDIARHVPSGPPERQEFAFAELEVSDSAFVYHWEADPTTAGYEYAAHVNEPVQVDLLEQPIARADAASAIHLLHEYNIRLVDSPSGRWSQEHAYRLLQTMKSIPQHKRDSYDRRDAAPSDWILTSDHVAHDIHVAVTDGTPRVTVSEAAFANAAPRLALVEGKRGRFYSQRLHHALVRFVTDGGTDEAAYERILRERYGLTTRVPDYRALTGHTTGGESPARFQRFHAEEIVRLINMLEEMPLGMHKIPELRFLVRRLNGTPHPLNPGAPAVAWPDAGYIEFMEEAFRNASDSEIHRLIIHEKAHFLWAHLFDEQLRQDWIKLGGWYRNDKARSGWSTNKQTEFVSSYAHDENPNEDMAESIAYFVVNPDKLRSRAPAKYEFIRDRIMQGSVYLAKIREDLTFEVYNLYPDYVYPGKISNVDIQVDGAPAEDKKITVVIGLHATDPETQGATFSWVRVYSEIGTWVDLGLRPVDDRARYTRDGAPGIVLRGELTLSKYAKAGYWAPANITLKDAHANERLYGSDDFGWQLYIDNPLEDVTAPEYVSGTITLRNSTETRDGKEVQVIHVEWEVKEDMAMPDWGCYAALNDAIHETYRIVEGWGPYDAERELCTAKFEIRDYMPTSVYSLNFIAMDDRAGNSSPWVFFGGDGEPAPEVEIVTRSPDLTPPELDVRRISISATPVRPDAPDGETIVTLTYHVRDVGSGYGIGWYYLRDPQGVDHHRYAYRNCTEGDPSDWMTCTDTVVLPRGSAPGTWGLPEMVVKDEAGNVHRYDFTEIVRVDIDCETEERVSAGGHSTFSAKLVAAVTTKVPCPPTFEVAH